ncbi:MAG: sodium:solute symporter family protein, partial [Deltaproteobacteria bacterium]|nr:sodium:solute symporter family protein [Deltaproteobacteria bacterium]
MTKLIIGVYLFLMLVIGIKSLKRIKSIEAFFVALRKGSTPFVTGSLVATIIGGSSTIGMAGLGFKNGISGAWWLLVGSIGLIILAFSIAKKVQKEKVYTLP